MKASHTGKYLEPRVWATKTNNRRRRVFRRCAPGAGVLVAAASAAVGRAGTAGARAQVIDEFLNADIPGYDTQAGVTVATRSRPQYDAPGIRLGNFILTPVLSESAGYDDDVTGTPHGKGSALIETNASVNAAGGWSDTRFAAGLSVDDNEYLEQSGQSFTNWSAALGGSHDFGRDTFSLGATYLNLNQTPRELDVPGLDTAIAYRVADLRSNYHVDLGHIFIQPGVDVGYYSFDNGTIGGQPYLQGYRDRIVVSPELIGSYEFATRRRLVVILRDTQSDFDQAPPGLPRQNFNDASVLAGLAYDADGIVGFRLLAGYEERSFASSRYRFIDAPIVEAAATWTPTGLTTITGSAERYIEDSAAENTVGYTETALKLQLDHEYLRNVIFTVHAAYFIDDYDATAASASASQTYFTGGFGGSYALNRNVRLAADYTYATRHSGNPQAVSAASLNTDLAQFGGAFGGNYSENTFRLTLRFAL